MGIKTTLSCTNTNLMTGQPFVSTSLHLVTSVTVLAQSYISRDILLHKVWMNVCVCASPNWARKKTPGTHYSARCVSLYVCVRASGCVDSQTELERWYQRLPSMFHSHLNSGCSGRPGSPPLSSPGLPACRNSTQQLGHSSGSCAIG